MIALAALLAHTPSRLPPRGQSSKIAAAGRFLRHSFAEGIRDGLLALRRSPIAVVGGSFGTMVFDLAVLGLTFKAFGHSPPVGILALGYVIGQLGGNVPVPGGIGGLDGGLVVTFALYHQPLAATTAAVLVYHAISLWIPALLGSVAFVLLRATLLREPHPTALCAPLAESIEVNTDRRLPADIAQAPSSSPRGCDRTGPTAVMKLMCEQASAAHGPSPPLGRGYARAAYGEGRWLAARMAAPDPNHLNRVMPAHTARRDLAGMTLSSARPMPSAPAPAPRSSSKAPALDSPRLGAPIAAQATSPST